MTNYLAIGALQNPQSGLPVSGTNYLDIGALEAPSITAIFGHINNPVAMGI